jgi:hypothetical protein
MVVSTESMPSRQEQKQMQDHTKEVRICTVCGRSYGWSKSRQSDWRQLRYCSESCSSRRLNRVDYRLEEALLFLLQKANRGDSICPGEAARFIDKIGWRSLERVTLNAARRLAVKGRLEMVADGRVVGPDDAMSDIRVRLPIHSVDQEALAS